MTEMIGPVCLLRDPNRASRIFITENLVVLLASSCEVYTMAITP